LPETGVRLFSSQVGIFLSMSLFYVSSFSHCRGQRYSTVPAATPGNRRHPANGGRDQGPRLVRTRPFEFSRRLLIDPSSPWFATIKPALRWCCASWARDNLGRLEPENEQQ
jgi:hypothetical protein